MDEIELHPGTPFCDLRQFNRLAKQQELSVVIAKASIYDDICRSIALSKSEEAVLVQRFLKEEDIENEKELDDYLKLRGWQADDLLYVAT